jgi:Fe-S cluster biosynthesis and repair protein YggX
MSIKVSLDCNAIEKLMRDDPQFVIDIKKGVIENFTQKCIRPMLNFDDIKEEINLLLKAHNEAKDAYLLAIKKEVENEIGKVKTTNSWGSEKTIIINEKFLERIRLEVNAQTEKVFHDMVKNAIDRAIKIYDEPYLKSYVDRYLSDGIKKIVKEEFQKRINTMNFYLYLF